MSTTLTRGLQDFDPNKFKDLFSINESQISKLMNLIEIELSELNSIKKEMDSLSPDPENQTLRHEMQRLLDLHYKAYGNLSESYKLHSDIFSKKIELLNKSMKLESEQLERERELDPHLRSSVEIQREKTNEEFTQNPGFQEDIKFQSGPNAFPKPSKQDSSLEMLYPPFDYSSGKPKSKSQKLDAIRKNINRFRPSKMDFGLYFNYNKNE